MAWTRFAQTGFEMGLPSELPFNTAQQGYREMDDSSPITGDLSLLQGTYGGMGYIFPSLPTQMRMAFLYKTQGSLTYSFPIIVYMNQGGYTGSIQWYFDQQNKLLTLKYVDYNGSTVESESCDFYDYYGFCNSQETIVAIGMMVSAGAGGFASLYLNGERILKINATASGLGQTLYVRSTVLGKSTFSGTYPTYYDDWYIDLGIGNADGIPPTKRYGIARPSSAGSSTEWTPTSGSNYENIDEEIGDDDDYNYTSLPTNSDEFNMDTFTLPNDSTIESVIPIVRAKSGTPYPARKIRTISYDGLIHDYGSEQDLLLGYSYFWERYLTDPAGSPWSESSVNSNEFGYELRS